MIPGRLLHPFSTFHRFFSAALLLAACPPRSLAANPQDYAVLVTAQVQLSPPRITLQWPASSFATGYTVSRKALTDLVWTPFASLSPASTSFTDTDVVPGAGYEYEISQSNSDGLNAYGYIYSGMEVPFPGNRGTLLLVVDDSFSSDLAAELSQLQQDLTGDGWTVLRHDVSRNGAPQDVQALIQADYQADPGNTRAVFLLGHVPVPYSGDIAPDMHANHQGAWPADVYYGVMNGTWTDSTVSDTSAEDPRNYNVPGDGRFDQSTIPGPVVLEVGRVDFNDLPSFAPRTELDLLRQYLNKDHNYRFGLMNAARRGLIRDTFGDINGDAPATDAWRAFVPAFGSDNIAVIDSGQFFPTLESSSYLMAYGGGGGEYYQADGVGSTTDFALQSPQAVFYMLDGSYFLDWDSTDNFLRAAMASSGYGLAAPGTGLPHWFFHPMALGETIGFVTRLTQNNQGLYKNQQNLSANEVHIALMGDPTLRLHVVLPPSNLSAQPSGNGSVNLNWSPSPDSVLGYYIYRAANPTGPFARVTRFYVTGTSYADTSVPPGLQVYIVRAVKLESSASGTYENPSQGIFATVGSGGGPSLPDVTIQAANPNASEVGSVEGDFVVSRDGATDSDLPVQFSITGNAINGTDYQQISTSIIIPSGTNSAWIPIKPIADSQADGNESVTLTLIPTGSYNVGSPNSATVNIQEAPVFQPPQISAITDQSITENSSTQPIPFSVSDAQTSADNLQLSASSSNPGLVPASGFAFSGSGNNRALLVTPAPNQSGTATITVSVSDGVGSSSTSFQLTVQPLNFSAARINSITRASSGPATLQFTGTPGHSYTVQYSEDLHTWVSLSSGTFNPAGNVSYQDNQAPPKNWRFYRVQSQ